MPANHDLQDRQRGGEVTIGADGREAEKRHGNDGAHCHELGLPGRQGGSDHVVEENREHDRKRGVARRSVDQRDDPAVEESPYAPECGADEVVHAAGTRHQGAELREGEGTGNREDARYRVGKQHEPGRADVAGHHARLHEDADADDVGDQERRRRDQRERARERVRLGVRHQTSGCRVCQPVACW